MGFNPPVPQQDSNWEIRVAPLLSLLLQVLLIFLGPMHKRSASLTSRFTIWSCYLLADWVADLGLGLILNNMGNIGGGGGNSSSSFGLKRAGGGGGGNNSSTSSDAAGSSGGSPIIFAFWTPFLLLHLGGPDTITAYSLEDNELWLRHLIGLLFELFSACVIFLCSLRGNPLIHTTVLMFMAGVIKYKERTYSLYCSSLERFRANILGPPDPGRNYARFMTEFDSKEKPGVDVEVVIPNKEKKRDDDDEVDVEVTRMATATHDKQLGKEAQAYSFFSVFRRLFVDLVLSSKQRRMAQAFFLKLEPREAFEIMELELGFIYDMVYTKGGPVAHTRKGWVLRSVCSVCLVSALVIFYRLDGKDDKHMMSPVDVSITYALLLGGLALDLVALAMLLLSDRAAVFLQKSRRRRWFWLRWLAKGARSLRWWEPHHWSRAVAQLNLIGYCTGRPDHHDWTGACWLTVSRLLGPIVPPEILQDLVFIWHMRLEKGEWEEHIFLDKLVPKCCRYPHWVQETLLFEFIFNGLKGTVHKLKREQEEKNSKAAMADGAGAATQKEDKEEDAFREKDVIAEVCRRRGDGVIKSHKDDIKWKRLRPKETMTTTTKEPGHGGEDRYKVILDSVVKTDFDESLLMWHIATDLSLPKIYQGPMDKKTMNMVAIGKCLSEYMLYLLVKQPDMLSARTGIWLMRYRDTCEEARRFLDSMAAPWSPDHYEVQRMLLSVNTIQKPAEVKGDRSKSVLFDGVILAKALHELDAELMWDIIAGVWTEMLLYAARTCPGSTHVRHLNRGGKLITVIWFLMKHMGLGNAHDVNTVDVPAKLIVHY